MKYLVNTVETYRADTEEEAEELIAEAKMDNKFILNKYTSQLKEIKSKGDVIDSYYLVALTKVFTDQKEPEVSYSVDYNREF